MRRWIGRWILGVGVVHNLVGTYFFLPTLREIADAGVWNSVDMDPMRNLAFWFLFSGFMIMLAGYVVDWIENLADGALPPALGGSLLALLLMGIVVMPASGFWLLIPAIWGCFRARHQHVGRLAPSGA
jgi:hypothetical protein